jgi:trimeric autotransporter adhesin
VAAAVVVVSALVLTTFLTRTGAGSEQHGLQAVTIGMGADTTVYSVTAASVTKDASGTVTETRVDLDPTASVGDLPVRVQTAWWHDGETGTDLSDLTGRSGRFVLQVTVQDLTAEATELGYESDGVRYEQQALVGVPLTVVASATVGSGDRVVRADDGTTDDARVTDGVLATGEDGGRSVRWAAFLAPPMLSPTADLTLVLDTEDFRVPDLDITVQPGLVTDPSVAALVDRAFGSDGYSAQLERSTIALVQRVNGQLTSALEFVDEVHTALVQDVSQIGEQTYRELEASSEQVLDHLAATTEDLEQILGEAEDGIEGVGTRTRTGVQALARSVDQVLGSTRARPRLTETVVEGCSVAVPTLAEGETRTVASTVYLADAQLQAVVDLFGSGSTGSGTTGAQEPSSTCRTALHALVLRTVGDPSALADDGAAAACAATPEDERTVACTLHQARVALRTDFTALAAADEAAQTVYQQLDAAALVGLLAGDDGLAATLTTLRQQVAAAGTRAGTQVADVAARAEAMGATTATARAAVAGLRAELVTAADAVERARSARDSLHGALLGSSTGDQGALGTIAEQAAGIQAVGAWFVGSDYASALADLVDVLGTGGRGTGGCDTGWSDGLGDTSTAEQVTAALGLLDTSTCPAQGLALATQALVDGYAASAEAAGSMSEQAAAAVRTVGTAFDDLDAALDDLGALTGETGTLAVALDLLEDGTSGTGALVDLATAAADLAALSAEGGDLAALDAALADLDVLVGSLWPDDTVQPVTDVSACPGTQPDTDARPVADGQAVVWLANRLLCLEAGLGDRLTGLSEQIDATRTAADEQLLLSTDRTQTALDQAGAEIDALSDRLVADVTVQQQAALSGSLDLIEEARARLGTEMDQVLATYDLAAGEVLTRLSESMQRSATSSSEVAAALTSDFADLLANLGTPDGTSRGGLLGKLTGITTQVGETGSVLDTAGSTASAYGNQRSGELRDIALRSAQYAAAQDRLAGYQPFAQVDEELETVFVFQIRADR